MNTTSLPVTKIGSAFYKSHLTTYNITAAAVIYKTVPDGQTDLAREAAPSTTNTSTSGMYSGDLHSEGIISGTPHTPGSPDNPAIPTSFPGLDSCQGGGNPQFPVPTSRGGRFPESMSPSNLVLPHNNLPLNPVTLPSNASLPGGTNIGGNKGFDPISSMAQMSQQLAAQESTPCSPGQGGDSGPDIFQQRNLLGRDGILESTSMVGSDISHSPSPSRMNPLGPGGSIGPSGSMDPGGQLASIEPHHTTVYGSGISSESNGSSSSLSAIPCPRSETSTISVNQSNDQHEKSSKKKKTEKNKSNLDVQGYSATWNESMAGRDATDLANALFKILIGFEK